MSAATVNITARDLMHPHVFTVRADWTIRELAEFLIDKNILGAPVADETGKLIGVVSETDIVRNDSKDRGDILRSSPHELYIHGWESDLAASGLSSFEIEEEHERFVRDIMSASVLKVDEFAPLSEIADVMVGSKVHRVFVTAHNKLVGVVTAMDLVGLLHETFKP